MAQSSLDPETDKARVLRERMKPARWEACVGEALSRVAVLDAVGSLCAATSQSWKRCLKQVSEDTSWSKYLHWRRRYEGADGPAWERLLDRRVMPVPAKVGEDVVRSACAYRRLDRGISCEAVRALLREEFGSEFKVSDTWLRRRWAAAGLGYVRPEQGKRQRRDARRRCRGASRRRRAGAHPGCGYREWCVAEFGAGCARGWDPPGCPAPRGHAAR